MSRESALKYASHDQVSQPATPAVIDEAKKVDEPVAIGTPEAERPTEEKLESDKFALWAKKEAAFVKQREEWKKERDAVLEKGNRADAILKKATEFEELRKTDPVAALKALGFNETEIFNFLAAQEKKELTPEEKAAQAAQEAAKKEIEDFKKTQEEAQKKAQEESDQKSITEFKGNMRQVMEGEKEKFEYCNYFGDRAIEYAYKAVLEVIKETNGEKIPTALEAMEMAEKYFEEEDKKMAQIKKRTPKVEEKPAEEQVEPSRSRQLSTPSTQQSSRLNRTLSNAAGPTSTSSAKPAHETRVQKRARLEDALRRGSL